MLNLLTKFIINDQRFNIETTQADRIDKVIAKQVILDYSEKDNNKTFFPVYRDTTKQKWIGKDIKFKTGAWKATAYQPYNKYDHKG